MTRLLFLTGMYIGYLVGGLYLNKKKILRVLSLVLMCILTTMLFGCGKIKDEIRFGAAGIGGGYYSFANAYTQIAEDVDDFKFEVKATAGSMANIRLLSEGYIDVAVAQMDMIDEAYYGSSSDDKTYRGYKAVAGLYTEACQIVVRSDSDIQSIDDLQGKTVSIGEAESGTEKNAYQILQICGLVSPLVETVNLDYITAADKLKAGDIDAFFCTAGISTNVISELSKECEIRLLSIDDSCVDKLVSAYGFYTQYTIPAQTYNGQMEEVNTLGVRSVLLVSDDMKAEDVKKLTQILFEHSQDLQYATSIKLQSDVNSAVEGITIPFHSGAAEYYGEYGVTVDTE